MRRTHLNLLIGFIFFVCRLDSLFAQMDRLYHRFSISVAVGNWQPHSLNDEPRFDSFGAAGATPFIAVSLLTPLGQNNGLNVSLGYWSLRELETVERIHSLTLHPFSVQIKSWLVPDYRLSAYVIYGGGIYWGIENVSSPFEKIRKARAGWGVNLGAGFDLTLTSHVGLGMSFQYNYVRFGEALGGVDDFSGPCVAGSLYYFL